MTDNYMIRRAIPDLLDKKYYIPEYQRGYRWEETQVLDLLQDLYAFFIGDTKGQFLSSTHCGEEKTDERRIVV